MISVVMLAAHKTPPAKPLVAKRESAASAAANTINGRNLLIYLVIVQGFVQISGRSSHLIC